MEASEVLGEVSGDFPGHSHVLHPHVSKSVFGASVEKAV